MSKEFFLLAFFFFGLVSTIGAQSLTNSKNTILIYEVFIDPEIFHALDSRELRSEKQKARFLQNQEFLNTEFYAESFDLLRQGLDAKSAELEPLSVLKEFDLEYNIYGYPIPSNSTAAIKQIKKGGYQSEYYLIFHVNIGIEESIFGSGGLSKKFRQKTTVDCTVLNPYGRKLRLVEGFEVSDRPTRVKDFPEKEFDKTDEESIEILLEFLTPGLHAAMDKMLNDL